MPHFEFKLDGLLRHRKTIERDRQKQLAAAVAQLRPLEAEMARIERAVADATADLRTNRLVGRVDVAAIAANRRYITVLQRQAVSVAQKMQLVQRQIDQCRLSLVEAAKDRKILEKLRDRQYQRWLEDQSRREAVELDEIGMRLAWSEDLEPADEIGGAA